MATMVKAVCANKSCKAEFEVRKADKDRGWGKYCSKSCKAVVQTRKTGWAGPDKTIGSRDWEGKEFGYPNPMGDDGMTDADWGHFPGEHDRN